MIFNADMFSLNSQEIAGHGQRHGRIQVPLKFDNKGTCSRHTVLIRENIPMAYPHRSLDQFIEGKDTSQSPEIILVRTSRGTSYRC